MIPLGHEGKERPARLEGTGYERVAAGSSSARAQHRRARGRAAGGGAMARWATHRPTAGSRARGHASQRTWRRFTYL